MISVGIVTPRYPPTFEGGGEKSVQLLAGRLVDADRISSVTVLSFDGREETSVEGVSVRRLDTVSPFLTEYQNLVAGSHLKSEISSFDVVHAYNMELHPAVGYLSKRRGVPSVGTLNSYHFFKKSVSNVSPGRLERLYELIGHPTTNRLLLRYVKQIDRFTALSEAIKRVYTRHDFPSGDIEVIPNMLDPSFDPHERTGRTDGCRLLYIGSLSQNKGVQYLIEALARLPDRYRLRIVGTGDQAEYLQNLSRSLNVSNRTTFEGWVPYEKIGEIYSSADMFVHPGVWPEPFGRTVLEAMQSGLPVVCTDIGGPPEVVSHPEAICDPADSVALAETIERVANIDQDIGEKNRQYATENFAPEVIVPRIVDLYEELVTT